MPLQLGALREALLDAGATTEKANAASEEVAAYDNRLASIESKLNLHSWILAFNTALLLVFLGKLFLI
jgi:hypothetical protein